MRSAFLTSGVGLLIAAACGCAQLTGLGDLAIGAAGEVSSDGGAPGAEGGAVLPGAPDGAPLDSTTLDTDTGAYADAPVAQDAPGARPDAEAGPPAPCVAKKGPSLVAVGSFCIDATEVTNDHYTAFLAASPPLSLLPGVECAFKTSFTPSAGWPAAAGKGSNPVVYVDWCDAYAYCAWAGEHLCGAIGGGSSSKAASANASVDEWYVACSASGARVYPYGGSVYIQGKCNDYESGTRGTRPVASFAGCEGGYSGIFDMNGNAYEWEDACDVSAGASDSCVIRGGSWNFSGAGYGSCNTYFNDYVVKRSDTFNDTGFRCCDR